MTIYNQEHWKVYNSNSYKIVILSLHNIIIHLTVKYYTFTYHIKKEYYLYTSLTASNTNSILIQGILINVSRKLFHGIIITLSIRFYKAINK